MKLKKWRSKVCKGKICITMQHKRRVPRFKLSFPVFVESGGAIKRLMASDVSDCGMLFLSSDPYVVGSKIKITFSLPSTDVELSLWSEVIHSKWFQEEDGGHFRIGVLFKDFDQEELRHPIRCLPM